MTGFWRSIYWLFGLEYIGKKEQECIDRQKHLKFMTCKQITDGGVKLKQLIYYNKIYCKNKILKKRRKK